MATTKTTSRISERHKKELLQRAQAVRVSDPDLAEGLRDIAYGRTISQEELFAKLGL